MDRARHLRVFDLHSWTGITLGLFVFVVSFTGCIALFARDEILAWADPAQRLDVPAQPIAIGEQYQAFLDANTPDQGRVQFTSIGYPNEYEPYYHAYLTAQDAEGEQVLAERRWNAQTGEVLPERGEGLAIWLLDFHRDLMWPDALGGRQIGRFLVGLAGIMLLLSIVSGVITHSKILQEFFALRFQRQVRLIWQDTHKVAGLWGLPFYATIAFTGAMLGIVTLVGPLIAFMVVKGDTETLIEVMGLGQTPPSGVPAEMLPIDGMFDRVNPVNGMHPETVIVANYGNDNATYQLQYPADTELLITEPVLLSAVTGERVPSVATDDRSVPFRAYSAMAPLHYGTYGGLSLKFFYLAMGLSLCVITALGNVMWIERRLHGREGKRSAAYYGVLSKLTVGVTMGLTVATVSVFYLDKLYAGAESARLSTTGWTYFAVWFLAIAYAFTRPNTYASTRHLMGIGAVGLMGLPVLNAVTTGGISQVLNSGHAVTDATDLTFLLLGALFLAIAIKLPGTRPERRERRASKAREPRTSTSQPALPVTAARSKAD
ncbi:MAG: PepSY-associated TM helix domain-containing protein [Pseudomonadota bacterium]